MCMVWMTEHDSDVFHLKQGLILRIYEITRKHKSSLVEGVWEGFLTCEKEYYLALTHMLQLV